MHAERTIAKSRGFVYTKRLFSTNVSASWSQNVQLQNALGRSSGSVHANHICVPIGRPWGAHGIPWEAHGVHAAPLLRPCGANGSPWTPIGDPWDQWEIQGGPMVTHCTRWSTLKNEGACHGRPMAPMLRPCGAHGSPWTPMAEPMGDHIHIHIHSLMNVCM